MVVVVGGRFAKLPDYEPHYKMVRASRWRSGNEESEKMAALARRGLLTCARLFRHEAAYPKHLVGGKK